MGSRTKPTGAATVAAPVTLAQLVASAVVLPGFLAEQPKIAQRDEQLVFAFSLDAFERSLATIPAEEFAAAFDAMLAEAYKRDHIEAAQPEEAEQLVEIQPLPEDEHAAIRRLLQFHKLPQAWQDAQGEYYFDEKAAQAAKAQTVITPEV